MRSFFLCFAALSFVGVVSAGFHQLHNRADITPPVIPPPTGTPPATPPATGTNTTTTTDTTTTTTGTTSSTDNSTTTTATNTTTSNTSTTSSTDTTTPATTTQTQSSTITEVVPATSDTTTSTSTSSTSTNTAAQNNTSPGGSSATSKGTIIGLSVAGGVALLGIAAFIIWKVTRKRFSDFDDHGEEIKWPELNNEAHALPTRTTGRAGIDDDGDEPGYGGGASLRDPSVYGAASTTTGASMADLQHYNDPYSVPPLPHLNPNQPYRDDPSGNGSYYDPYRGPVPQSLHDPAGPHDGAESIPMSTYTTSSYSNYGSSQAHDRVRSPDNGRTSPGPSLAYGGRQSPGPVAAYGRQSPGPAAGYGGHRTQSPGPIAAYGGGRSRSPGPANAYAP